MRVAVNSGGTLAGTGVVSGPVSVNSGGTLTLGNPLGTLTISNKLTFASGSTVYIRLENVPLTNAAVLVTAL
jgi:uncharacterized protein with beta-barrel porin domain